MPKIKIFGVRHHSPMDVMSILPVGTSMTFDAEEESTVLFSQRLPSGDVRSKIVLVFQQQLPDDITVLDETKPGEIRTLTSRAIDQIFLTLGRGKKKSAKASKTLKRKSKPSTPKFKKKLAKKASKRKKSYGK